MFRRKADRITCSSCQKPVERDAKLCSCGQPTVNMTFDERRAYEVERWRSYRTPTST